MQTHSATTTFPQPAKELLAFVNLNQLQLAQKIQQSQQGPLEIILWQLGFITIEQLALVL